MMKKTYLETFEQINYHLCNGKRVYAYDHCSYFTREYGLLVWNSDGNKEYNTLISIPAKKGLKRYWIEEEIEDPAVKPEIGFVFETNRGHQVYINLKEGNKFYGVELNGKKHSGKVFNENGRVEKRDIYLVKKVK